MQLKLGSYLIVEKIPNSVIRIWDSLFNWNYYDYSISEILNVFTIPLLAIDIEARLMTISPFVT